MYRDVLGRYSFSDGEIIKISHVDDDNLLVTYKLWDGRHINFEIKNCWYIMNKKAVGIDIEDVKMIFDTKSIDIIEKDILNTGGGIEEIENLFELQFISSWEGIVVLKIVADKIFIRDVDKSIVHEVSKMYNLKKGNKY